MNSVIQATEKQGFPDDAWHLEHFSLPELPNWVDHPFILRLARSGLELLVPENKTAAEVLAEAGIHLDVKCSNGLCGVCKCGLVSGEGEHRDFVLSKRQRQEAIILCQSRALHNGAVVEIDL